MERLSNEMNRVVRLTNWHEPIEEGYFPKLDNIVANRVWPPRPNNTKLRVIYDFGVSFTLPMPFWALFQKFFFHSIEHQQRCRTDKFRHRRSGTVERPYIQRHPFRIYYRRINY